MQIKRKSETEFIIVMASMMSLAALAIDALLPGLNDIAYSIGILDSKNNQLLVTMIFLGLGIGQLISGPLSDSFGRKPILYVGFAIFAIASLLCVLSTSLEMMVYGRILQGIGLSAPRTLSVAMVRDRFSGNYMAKVMSFVTAIFILVPVVAPSIGKLLLDNFGWEAIFHGQLIFGVFVTLWIWRRQPETLIVEKRKKFSISLFVDGVKEFMRHENAVVFTFVSGFVSSAFMVYLSASQHIFQVQYNLVEEFPYIFAGLAASIGVATFLNGIFVVKFGMFRIASIFSIVFTVISFLYVVIYWGEPNPSIVILVVFSSLLLFAIGFMFGNINALAMQPIGHIAGIGAAIIGFVSTIISVPIAIYIGGFIQTTALPLFAGFLICGTLSIMLIQYLRITRKGSKA